MRKLKYAGNPGEEFAKELKSEVNNYFNTKGISKNGDIRMVIKTIIIMLIYLAPIALLSTGLISSIPLIFILYIISGVGVAGIGMTIMHDALHGSYSKNKNINKMMGYSINLIGACASVWKVQHNVLHHTYTNIAEADDDLNASALIRMSPDSKHLWIHKYQHLYVWILYGMMSLMWVTARDFVRFHQFRQKGFYHKPGELRNEIIKAIFWKTLYFSYALALPMIMIPQAWWIVLLAFLSMHFITGSILSYVFQTAHVMPSNEFPKADENGMVLNNWHAHQMATTTNFAPNNKLLSWYIGGLNYQVEHHLMPHICHIHYPALSKIVKKTAEKHNIPYNCKPTFLSAVADHILMLKRLGTVK